MSLAHLVYSDDPVSDYDDQPLTLNPTLISSFPQLASSASAMSTAVSASTSTPATAPDVKIDHRKKRRNRTTQSCLSCHQNKRKVKPPQLDMVRTSIYPTFFPPLLLLTVRSWTSLWKMHYSWLGESSLNMFVCWMSSFIHLHSSTCFSPH